MDLPGISLADGSQFLYGDGYRIPAKLPISSMRRPGRGD